MAWSLVTLEKWVSRMVTVPVRATWPHPQNKATPEKQRIVATSDAYGTPPKHLMQHSKQPVQKKKRKNCVRDICNWYHDTEFYGKSFYFKRPHDKSYVNISPKFYISDSVSLVGQEVISGKLNMGLIFRWIIHSSFQPLPVHTGWEAEYTLDRLPAYHRAIRRIFVTNCIRTL